MARSTRHKLSTTAKQAHHGLLSGLRSLLIINPIPRPLPLLLLCSLCMAGPLFAGVLTNNINIGLTACIGALIGLYSPSFTPGYRAGALGKMLLPFSASFAFGLLTQHSLSLSALSLAIIALLAVYFARVIQMRPPASFFFIMVCCLAKTHHVDITEIPLQTAAFFSGSLLVTVAVYLFDQLTVSTKVPPPTTLPIFQWQHNTALQAAIIALTTGGSYYIASISGFNNPYWVPITVAAILQGQRMTDFWQRSLHRATGTALGMLLAAGIFALSPTPLVLIGLLFILSLTIEMLITKNYALACIFITPLTVILAHTAPIGYSADTLILARMVDVLIGAIFALAAGVVLKAIPGTK